MDSDNFDKFDFLTLAPHGTGEHAIFRYLELHPNIYVTASETIGDSALASYAAPLKKLFGDEAQTGWVFPAMQRLQDHPESVSEIMRHVKGNVFIQLVRDPVRLLVSLYNNTMKLYSNDILPDFSFEEFVGRHLATAFFHRIGCRFATHFKRWEVVDLTDISGDKAPETMRKLYSLLNVPVSESLLKHPAFITSQNDIVQSFLRITPFNLKVLGVRMNFMMQTEGSLDFVGSRSPSILDMGEARFEAVAGIIEDVPVELQAAFKTSSLKIFVDMRDWLKIHSKAREQIVRSNMIGKQFARTILPLMMEKFKTRMSVPRLSVDDLDKGLIERIKGAVAHDARALFQHTPELREKWDICGNL